MEENKDFYFQEARRIIELIKRDFRLDNGALCLERYNKVIFPHHIFPDLGDFVPFFLYFNEEKFIDGQIDIFRSVLKNGILISEFPSFHIRNLAKSYEYTDLLFGLFDYYVFKKNEPSLKLLMDSVNKAIDIFKFETEPSSLYYPKLNFHAPIFDTRDGTFIEFFVELYKLTSNKNYLDIAYDIYKNLIKTAFYRKNHLFPTFVARSFIKPVSNLISDKFTSSQIHKNDTNGLFGLLSLYKETKDRKVLGDIYSIIESLKNKAIFEKGGVITVYDPDSSEKRISLSPSFHFLDFLCDFYHLNKRKEDLNCAEDIASYWLCKQGRTGLFPHFSGTNSSFFDSETDMCVALYKLYELTNNKAYYDGAERCFWGIINFHGKNNYVLGVDIDSGEIKDNTQRTKFIALFLKLLILKIETDDGKSIYKNQKLLNLIKDR